MINLSEQDFRTLTNKLNQNPLFVSSQSWYLVPKKNWIDIRRRKSQILSKELYDSVDIVDLTQSLDDEDKLLFRSVIQPTKYACLSENVLLQLSKSFSINPHWLYKNKRFICYLYYEKGKNGINAKSNVILLNYKFNNISNLHGFYSKHWTLLRIFQLILEDFIIECSVKNLSLLLKDLANPQSPFIMNNIDKIKVQIISNKSSRDVDINTVLNDLDIPKDSEISFCLLDSIQQLVSTIFDQNIGNQLESNSGKENDEDLECCEEDDDHSMTVNTDLSSQDEDFGGDKSFVHRNQSNLNEDAGFFKYAKLCTNEKDQNIELDNKSSRSPSTSPIINKCESPPPKSNTSSDSSSRVSSIGRKMINTSIDSIKTKNVAGLCGLQNLGNTCFLNSTLQCLSNIVDLRNYFRYKLYMHEDSKSSTKQQQISTKYAMSLAFSNLMQEMWCTKFHNTKKKSFVDPREMKFLISKVSTRFRGYSQNDSQEAMCFLLDAIHEEIKIFIDFKDVVPKSNAEKYSLSLLKKCNYDKVQFQKLIESKRDEYDCSDECLAEMFRTLHSQNGQSIINELFSGQIKSTVQCLNCYHYSRTFDPFIFMCLPVNIENNSIELSGKLSVNNNNKSSKNNLIPIEKPNTHDCKYAVFGNLVSMSGIIYPVAISINQNSSDGTNNNFDEYNVGDLLTIAEKQTLFPNTSSWHCMPRLMLVRKRNKSSTHHYFDVVDSDFGLSGVITPKSTCNKFLFDAATSKKIKKSTNQSKDKIDECFGKQYCLLEDYFLCQYPPTLSSSAAGNETEKYLSNNKANKKSSVKTNPTLWLITAADKTGNLMFPLFVFESELRLEQNQPLSDMEELSSLDSFEETIFNQEPSCPDDASFVMTKKTENCLNILAQQAIKSSGYKFELKLTSRKIRLMNHVDDARLKSINRKLSVLCFLVWFDVTTNSKMSIGEFFCRQTEIAYSQAAKDQTLNLDQNKIKLPIQSSQHKQGNGLRKYEENLKRPYTRINNPNLISVLNNDKRYLSRFNNSNLCTYNDEKMSILLIILHRRLFDMYLPFLGSSYDNNEITLSQCISMFTETELLDNSNNWHCPMCARKCSSLKKIDIYAMPPYLLIQLKRFKQLVQRRQKLNTLVQFPIDLLDFSPFIYEGADSHNEELQVNDGNFKMRDEHRIKNTNRSCMKYELIAVSNHSGNLYDGHYITHAKNSCDNNWYTFNDTFVRQINPNNLIDHLVTGNAYILVYKRISDDANDY